MVSFAINSSTVLVVESEAHVCDRIRSEHRQYVESNSLLAFSDAARSLLPLGLCFQTLICLRVMVALYRRIFVRTSQIARSSEAVLTILQMVAT